MKSNTTRGEQTIKRFLQKVRLRYLARQDVARFSRTAPFSAFDAGYEQLTSRIMYNVHAIEKGLARTGDRRLGFGRTALSNLNDSMVVYRTMGHGLDGFAYTEGMSIVQRYVELHGRLGHDVSFLEEIIDPQFLHPELAFDGAGTKVVRRVDKAQNSTKNFPELAGGRSSVREFSGDPIDSEKVMNALRIAERTPSVCNRQGWRVYWVEDKERAGQVLRHQRGFGYPQMPEVLLTITVSNNTYLSPVERNQGFVDGGLFAMSVMYGLEYEGLGVVPLNACLYSKAQRAVRKLLDIDDSEVIIMFMAIGALQEESIVPISDRKPAESFIRRR